jgi:hypothetical protein
LLGGLFGWVWIFGSLAVLGFAAAGVLGYSSWWNTAYALIVSAVAKWLASGFEDHRKREYIEAQLMAQGMTPQQASEAWAKAYLR